MDGTGRLHDFGHHITTAHRPTAQADDRAIRQPLLIPCQPFGCLIADVTQGTAYQGRHLNTRLKGTATGQKSKACCCRKSERRMERRSERPQCDGSKQN